MMKMQVEPFSELYREEAAGLAPEEYREMMLHGDVFPDSAVMVTASSGRKGKCTGEKSPKKRFFGFGYLIAGQSYISRKKMPENSRFHAQIVFRTDLRTEEGVDAAELLLKTLTEKCAGFGKKDPAYPVTPRVWVDERDEAYAGFLETFGFRETDRMWVMERKLAGETVCRKSEKKQADRDCHISDLTKDLLAGYRPGSGEGPSGELRDYISATEAAFGIPDSFAEMEYRLYCGGGRVFTLDRKSYVTVWPLGEGTFATENVFTRPEHQRSGLCRELLNGTAEILRQEGAERVRLNVYDWNKGAIALYGSVGYEHVRTLREMTAET